jgi:ribosome biogenesis protein ERB1
LIVDIFIKNYKNNIRWRQIRDELNQKDVTLTDEQLFVIDRLRKGKFASKSIAEGEVNKKYRNNFILEYK